MKARLALAIATGLGCGYFPKAPGTAGSLLGLALAIVAQRLWHWGAVEFLLLAVIWLVPAIWASALTASSMGDGDPSIVVIDEVLGQWITLAGVTSYHWQSWLAAFVLFRLFDIWKPPPLRQLERLTHGVGIVADDVGAGVFGALVLFAAGCFNLY